MKIDNPVERGKMSLEEHLMSRELVDFDILTAQVMNGQEGSVGVAEINLNQEVLAKVAKAWENDKEGITAVIAARIKPLIIQAALSDIPQEVMVTRQAILELIGLLKDFSNLHQENVRRSQKTRPEVVQKEEVAPTEGT